MAWMALHRIRNTQIIQHRSGKMKILDLEQEIMKAWHVIDDIQLLNENVMETDMSTDDIVNTLIGLESIYNMRFQKVFSLFEEVCKEFRAMRKEV